MRIASFALVGALLAAVVCLSITPARHFTQDLAVCRGGERAEGTTSVVATDGRTAGDFAFICDKDSGPVGVSKASAILGGVGVSLLLGGLAGAVVGVVVTRRR